MIIVKNNHVGFGDYINVNLFNKENQECKVIIDCGTNLNVTSRYKKLINNDLKSNCSFILTHFHDDHYKIIYDNKSSIETFFVRKPELINGYIDIIAVACLKIICFSEENFKESSAWFIIDIVNQLTNHFMYSKIHFFEDGESLMYFDRYKIVSIKYPRRQFNSLIDMIMIYFEKIKPGITKIITKLSAAYYYFISKKQITFSIQSLIYDLLEYRKNVQSFVHYWQNNVFALYDEVVNDSSAVIGLFRDDQLQCLFLADVGIESQKNIFDVCGPVVMLKLSHHGTENYNSFDLISKFNAENIILTYGKGALRKENILAQFLKGLYKDNIDFEEYIME